MSCHLSQPTHLGKLALDHYGSGKRTDYKWQAGKSNLDFSREIRFQFDLAQKYKKVFFASRKQNL